MTRAIIALVTAVTLTLSGLTLVLVRRVQAAGHDPNATDEDERKQLGQQRAVLKKDLERMIQEQQDQAE